MAVHLANNSAPTAGCGKDIAVNQYARLAVAFATTAALSACASSTDWAYQDGHQYAHFQEFGVTVKQVRYRRLNEGMDVFAVYELLENNGPYEVCVGTDSVQYFVKPFETREWKQSGRLDGQRLTTRQGSYPCSPFDPPYHAYTPPSGIYRD